MAIQCVAGLGLAAEVRIDDAAGLISRAVVSYSCVAGVSDLPMAGSG